MDNSRTPLKLVDLIVVLFCSIFWLTNGNPVYLQPGAKENKYTNDTSNNLDCNPVEYSAKDVIIFKNKDLFLKSKKLVIDSKNYLNENNKIFICPRYLNVSSENATLSCKEKFAYGTDEYEIVQNGSALVHGSIIPRESYMLENYELLTCVVDYDDNAYNDSTTAQTLNSISINIGNIGSGISKIALIIHLITFCFLPSLRNLPGYNLASLSVAFLLAYSFMLIGQIPEVIGLFCVISAILEQNFFLAAFFCMNVMAFDVWRTLKLATEQLAVGSQNTRKRQFLWYSLYSWGCPFLITAISVIVNNIDSVPSAIKPLYGKNDTCWLTNNFAKTIFFAAPAFTLFLINGIFFIRSFWMISNNRWQFPNDHNKQAMKLNYILYLRLAIMMGLTWLVGVIGVISKNETLWFIFDILNSLQGLFLLLFFTCRKKIVRRVIEKTNSKSSTSEKQISISSSFSNFNSKH